MKLSNPKKYTIARAYLLFAILIGGVTACNHSNSSEAPQSADTTQATPAANSSPSDNTQAKEYQTAERTRKREAIRKQIEAVLTPDQVQQLQTKLQQGERMRSTVASLNLTADQKTKVQEIMKAAYAQKQKTSPGSSQ